MRAPACMITSAFVAQLATCVGYERCWLFIPRRCRIRIAAYIFSRAEMQTCALKDSTAYVTTSCGCRPKVHKWLAGLHAEAPQGHAGPHRLADKMSPSQPSSVGTEATCPVVVAHILARWRMPMVRPVCPCTWVVPLVGLGSTLGGEGGGGLSWVIGGRAYWPANAWPPAWSNSRVPSRNAG